MQDWCRGCVLLLNNRKTQLPPNGSLRLVNLTYFVISSHNLFYFLLFEHFYVYLVLVFHGFLKSFSKDVDNFSFIYRNKWFSIKKSNDSSCTFSCLSLTLKINLKCSLLELVFYLHLIGKTEHIKNTNNYYVTWSM